MTSDVVIFIVTMVVVGAAFGYGILSNKTEQENVD
jgi:hypothetical protein